MDWEKELNDIRKRFTAGKVSGLDILHLIKYIEILHENLDRSDSEPYYGTPTWRYRFGLKGYKNETVK